MWVIPLCEVPAVLRRYLGKRNPGVRKAESILSGMNLVFILRGVNMNT